jgi:hypothetical protein
MRLPKHKGEKMLGNIFGGGSNYNNNGGMNCNCNLPEHKSVQDFKTRCETRCYSMPMPIEKPCPYKATVNSGCGCGHSHSNCGCN